MAQDLRLVSRDVIGSIKRGMVMKRLLCNGVVAIGLLTSATAHATLALTAAGITDGFSLSTFATIDPGNTGFGPFGLAVNNNNQVIVSDTVSGKDYIFSDVDGQTPGSALQTCLLYTSPSPRD